MNQTIVSASRGKALLLKVVALVRQPLFANAGYLMGVNLVGATVGFVFWGLAARLYRPEDIGIASAALSAVALVSGIARLGMDHGLVRFLPEAQTAHRLLNTALTFNAMAALLVAGAFLIGLPLWSPGLIGLRQNALHAIGFVAYAALETVGAVIRMAFVARRRALYALIQMGIVNGGRLLLIHVLAGLGAVGLIGSVACAVMLAVVVSLSGFLPRVEPGYRLYPGICASDLATLIPYSVGNYIAGLLTQASQTVLPLVVLEMLGPASGGYAYIAWMLGSLLASPGMALAVSAFAEGSNFPQQLALILSKSVVAGLLLTVLAAAIVGVGAPHFLSLFGSSYAREACGLVRWLAAAAPLVVLSGLYFTYLRVQKRVGRLILLGSLIAAITLGLAVLWMPRFGIVASGMGWLVGNGLVAVLAVGDMWKATL